MGSAISAQNLEIGYASGTDVVLVSRIPSLDLKKGKLTCLLGANGIGKSTLLKTITGHLNPLRGIVALDDINLTDLSVKEKAQKLAIVLTDKAHLGFTTVREMITLGRNPYTNWMNSLRTTDNQAINQALKAIDMIDMADRPLAELSDGNLQKVIIGRAIAQETDIIILDEPTIHLDITNKTIIVGLLRKLCQEHGKTILFSTHDLELAKVYADELWIMAKDQLIQGLTEDIILAGIIDKNFKQDAEVWEELPETIILNGPQELTGMVKRAITKSGIKPLGQKTIDCSEEPRFTVDDQSFTTQVELIDYLAAPKRIK